MQGRGADWLHICAAEGPKFPHGPAESIIKPLLLSTPSRPLACDDDDAYFRAERPCRTSYHSTQAASFAGPSMAGAPKVVA